MNNTPSNPRSQKPLKEIVTAVVLIFITLAALKFFAWHFWRVRQAYLLAKGVIHAPAAVNVTIAAKNNMLLKRSFAFNRKDNAYIIDRFDVTALGICTASQTSDTAEASAAPVHITNPPCRFTINGDTLWQYDVFAFPQYYILHYKDYYFVFTVPHRDIETLITLNHTLGDIIKTLPAHVDDRQ